MNPDNRKRAMRTAAALLGAVLVLVLAACGSGDSSTEPGTDPPDYSSALDKAPPKLKALYEQGGTLASGGLDGFSEQLAAVEGYPVVVNNWASWCGPCRTEWPWFQRAAADNLDRVAFIGVDGDDEDAAARTFLDDHPVPYPSTLFFDRGGELVYTHQGVYPDQATLEADIRKYALGES